MNFLNDFFNNYGGKELLGIIITALAGYIGTQIKKMYQEHLNDATKKAVAKTCVRAIEQIYKELHGQEKLDKCMEAMTEMLGEKGIHVTEIEMRMLIESAVNEFNSSIAWYDFLDDEIDDCDNDFDEEAEGE